MPDRHVASSHSVSFFEWLESRPWPLHGSLAAIAGLSGILALSMPSIAPHDDDFVTCVTIIGVVFLGQAAVLLSRAAWVYGLYFFASVFGLHVFASLATLYRYSIPFAGTLMRAAALVAVPLVVASYLGSRRSKMAARQVLLLCMSVPLLINLLAFAKYLLKY